MKLFCRCKYLCVVDICSRYFICDKYENVCDVLVKYKKRIFNKITLNRKKYPNN